MASFHTENSSQRKSTSTLRSRRFERTGRNQSQSRSSSVNSNNSQLAKFYVKNVPNKNSFCNNQNKKNKQIQSKSLALKNRLTSHFQDPLVNVQVQNKKQTLKNINKGLIKIEKPIQFRLQSQKQCQRCRLPFATDNYVQKTQSLTKQITKVQQQNSCLLKRVRQQYQTIKQLKDSQNSITEVKNLLYQNKIFECQQQNQSLKNQILQLEKTIQELKTKDTCHFSTTSLSIGDFDSFSIYKQLNCDESLIQTGGDAQTIQNLEKQLQSCKNETAKLHLFYNTELRKTSKQYQTIIMHKDQEYLQLKKKFMSYLKTYKQGHKISSSVKAKQKLIESKLDCDESIFSLSALSSEEPFFLNNIL